MSTRTAPAPQAWEQLEPLAQAVALALAVGAVPRPRTWVYQALAEAPLRPEVARRPTQEAVRDALQQLAQAAWAHQDLRRTGYWALTDAVLPMAWSLLLDQHELPLLRELLAQVDGYPSLALARFGMGRMPSVEAGVARVRLELLSGADEAALMALAPRLPWGMSEPEGLLSLALNDLDAALDTSLLRRLAPTVRQRWLTECLAQWCVNWRLPSQIDLAECVRQEQPSLGTPLGALWAEACLLRADRAGLDALLQPVETDPRSPALWQVQALAWRAGAELLQLDPRPDWAAAAQVLADAQNVLRKLTGKRRGLLPGVLGPLYALALLGQNTPAHWQQALKFCLAEGGKREPVLDAPYGFIALALRMRLGEQPRDLAVFRPYTFGGQVPASPLDLWRWLMRAWLKEGAVAEDLGPAEADAAQRLQARLAAAGLQVWGGQLSAALQVLAGERSAPGFFVPSARERWELALDALQAVVQPAHSAPETPSETRLCWVLEVDARGAVHGLQAVEQKQGLRGWGKPKEVPLSRLMRTAEALPPVDAAVARCIRQDAHHRQPRVDLALAVGALLGHPRLALDDAPEQFIELIEAQPELDVVQHHRSAAEGGERLRVRMLPAMAVASDEAAPRWAGSALEQKELEALRLVCVLRDGPQRARLIRLNPAQKRVAQLLGAEGLDIPLSGASKLQEVLSGLGAHFRIQADEAVSAQAARELPTESRLRAELSPVGDGLQLRLVAAPLGEAYAADGPRLIPGSGRARLVLALRGESLGVQRDLAAERAHVQAVLEACPMLLPVGDEAPCEWLLEQPEQALSLVERLRPLPALAAMDWPKGQPMRVDSAGLGQLAVQVHTKQEWLAVQGELQVDEQLVLGLQQLISLSAGSRSRFIALGEGRYLALTQELRERLQDLAAVSESQRAGANLAALRIPTVAAPWVQEALQGTQLQADSGFATRLDRLDAARRVVPALPSTLHASLRPYQEEGFEWAMRLAHAGLGACLADDMGLGKTLQALAVLLARSAQGPALVVAPTSLVGNWRAEARRFAPSLRLQVHAEEGPAAERQAALAEAGAGTLVLVSYQMLQLDADAFAGRRWATLVMDEAQAIKNAAAKRSQAVFALEADFRLALSGTPIENRLAELWSIMRACNPGLLGSLARFNERFAGPIERQRDRSAQRQLRRLIAPFILRRTKAEVLADLPPRTELILSIKPDAAEQAHYEALRRDTLAGAERALAGDARGQAHLNILAGLTRLRRAACDPRLVSPQLGRPGAKVQAFGELAAELVANGHKALVFSQFVDFLGLLKGPLDEAGIPYQYLDGSTPAAERTRRVDAFQAGQGELFLISLKAGGFGLNLTVADYVVIADPWWNPAAEDQASGRAHRIGQQRPVTVYRLVNEGTLEEKILGLHRDKRELADLLLEGGEAAAVPQAEELLALMRGDVEAAPQAQD